MFGDMTHDALQAERAEKEKVKRMTLEINERQEEEEAAETLQQVSTVHRTNYNPQVWVLIFVVRL